MVLHDYAVCTTKTSDAIKVVGEHAHVQVYRDEPYLERESIETIDGKIVLYKRVSNNFLTQENTPNATAWQPGTTVEHPAWNPTQNECGAGKYHAVSKPFHADRFRDVPGDRYVAISIAVEDLYEWPNGEYPHKIAFRKGSVLYECDRDGKVIGE